MRPDLKSPVLAAMSAVMAAMSVHAALVPAALFSDHCVLQRGKKVPVWGKANPGATVTVSFAGQDKKTKADADGRWRIDLDPLETSCEPRSMRIASDGAVREEVVLKDVLVGVVWLCGGQSNMALRMWPAPSVSKHAGREINGYYDLMLTSEPLVRGVNMPQCWSEEEKDHGTLKWFAFTPDNYNDGMDFSAAAWHFAVRLSQRLKIPVGVIESVWGGTCIETWIPPDGYAASEHFKELATRKIAPSQKQIEEEKRTGRKSVLCQQARACWNAMICPLAPYGIEGAIWYQGCSNRGNWRDYYEMLTALRTGWSKRFEIDDMPFFLCQIAPFEYNFKKEEDDPGNIRIREEMERFGFSNGNKVGCAILSDIGELDCIHPGDKRTVGTRLAALALNRIYGMKRLKCDAPVFDKAVLSDDGKRVTLSFKHVEGWCMKGSYAPRFELMGTNGVYVAVECQVKPNAKTIDLKVPEGMRPVGVAYMRRECVHGFLKNEVGLPLGPFRGLVKGAAATFPLEWNEGNDVSVPYEVEMSPKKLGLSGSGRYSVLADGKEIAASLLPGKSEGAIRLRFRVPKGTHSLSCSVREGSMPVDAAANDIFANVLGSASRWSFAGGTKRPAEGGMEFQLKSGDAAATCEAAVPGEFAGHEVQFEVEVENTGRFPSPSNIFIDQYDAEGRLLPETVNDPRWTSHLRPPGVRQRMVNPGRLHPKAKKLRFVATLAAPHLEWDEYGEPIKEGTDTSSRLRITRLVLRPGALLPFPKYADDNFAAGASGQSGDYSLRLGGERCNAACYQTRSWASWAGSETRKPGTAELRDEKSVFFPSGAGTCEAWFKPEWPSGQKEAVHLFSGERHLSRNSAVKVVRDPVLDLTYAPALKELRFSRMDVAGKTFEGRATVDIPAGEWVHVAVTWKPGDVACVWIGGRHVLSASLEGFKALDLASAKCPSDEDVMELYIGCESRQTRRSERMASSGGANLFSGLVDNWRVSTGVRYAGKFSPSREFRVDGDTRALFTFDRSYSGVSGGGFGWIPLTFYSTKDRVEHRLATDGGFIQYYPESINADVDPLAVFDIQNYRKLPTARDFLAGRRRMGRDFNVKPGDKVSFEAGRDAVADYFEIANNGRDPIVNPFVVGKGEVDTRSWGDMRDSLFPEGGMSPKDRADRAFQFMLSASDYYMTHQAYFPFDGGDRCSDIWFQALCVLNSYCGFECGPLNNMTKNLFACSAGLPATMTQGYAHTFEQVFYGGKNHVYDLSAQKFFPAFDNETAAELCEMDEQPGLMMRGYGKPDHFIRNGSRTDIANAAPFMRKFGFTLNPGERFRAWWDNNGEGNDLIIGHQVERTPFRKFCLDYTDKVHADRRLTRYPVCRSHRYIPHYGNAFLEFDGRPDESNPAFSKSEDGFAYHVRSPYPVVAAEYRAVRKSGGEARLEISTDCGKTYRPLPSGLLRYEVRARHDYWVRVCEPAAAIERFSASTEVQVNSRVLPGRTKPGMNEFLFKGRGGQAKVSFAWHVPEGRIEVGGALHFGTVPGAERALVVCDPSLGQMRRQLSGVSAKAAAKAVGQGAKDVSVSVSNGALVVSAKPGAKGFYAFVVEDCGREKPFDLLVCEGARLVCAADFTPVANAELVRAGGDLVQDALVFREAGAKATARFPSAKGRFAVMPLYRTASGSYDHRLMSRLKIEMGGKLIGCACPVDDPCNYLKAMYGEKGGRANWKWDFPIYPGSWYQMLVPDLLETDSMTVTRWGPGSRLEEVELAAILMVPDPDFDLQGDLIRTLCGLNTQRGKVR